ncbi:cell division protein FtsQ/DivIB [Litoreibacter roseus]|uniref:Cell division protein FtsQ n=1 Tax=Litoreibacter roseus TaxID=2601869 RepID=A0A6N6JBD0_9RHOB|nr:cell division protein FtsQ/DivIB [Litoreibacter roseus]GFE63561.1 cell division protein FtsQ [Litoreibacter roseus]
MRQMKENRPDPAPSRVSYRLNRLWLTPMFRTFIRVVMPICLILALVVVWASDIERVRRVGDKLAEVRASIEARPEFMVKLMAIDGATPDLATSIRDVTPLNFPISSFDLDLEYLKSQVELLDAVKRADVRIKSGGVLQIDVVERVPAVVWRSPDGLVLLDAQGHLVSSLEARIARADLPLIVGAGAGDHVPEALALLSRATPIRERIQGIIRLSETRWDIVLDDNQRLMLPEVNPLDALDRVLALDEAQDLFGRDITHIDMRNGARPTLRMSEIASDELKAMQAIQRNAALAAQKAASRQGN